MSFPSRGPARRPSQQRPRCYRPSHPRSRPQRRDPLGRERIPDVCVVRHAPEGDRLDEVPAAAVEVVFPGTLTEDTVRKSAECFASGVEQYWLADPAALTVDAPGLGAVHLDRAALFR